MLIYACDKLTKHSPVMFLFYNLTLCISVSRTRGQYLPGEVSECSRSCMFLTAQHTASYSTASRARPRGGRLHKRATRGHTAQRHARPRDSQSHADTGAGTTYRKTHQGMHMQGNQGNNTHRRDYSHRTRAATHAHCNCVCCA